MTDPRTPDARDPTRPRDARTPDDLDQTPAAHDAGVLLSRKGSEDAELVAGAGGAEADVENVAPGEGEAGIDDLGRTND